MENFNDLNAAEIERLAILAEECGKVVQIVGKILRHGYRSFDPGDKLQTTNRRLLERELGDLQWIIRHMDDAGDIDISAVILNSFQKAKKVELYLHHQDGVTEKE